MPRNRRKTTESLKKMDTPRISRTANGFIIGECTSCGDDPDPSSSFVYITVEDLVAAIKEWAEGPRKEVEDEDEESED